MQLTTDKQKGKKQMDHQVDRMKFCGFRLNLLGFSSFLSVLGIAFGFMLGIGGLFFLESGAQLPRGHHFDITRVIFYIIGGVLLILMIPNLIMWILLKIKSSKQNIPGIERIGKVYSIVSGTLEIIGGIVRILFSCIIQYSDLRIVQITVIIYSAVSLIFSCLKIHGTRVKNNKLLGTYLVFCYALLIFYIIAFIIFIVSASRVLDDRNMGGFALSFALLIASIVYLILDISFTVILHSIRVDRENTAGTENPIENI